MTTPTTIETITGERALELLREVVAAAGANVVYRKPEQYDVCVYVHAGAPSCLVGHALLAAGAQLEDLELLGDGSIEGVREVGALRFDEDAIEVFTVAQELQDEGMTWGAALQAASDVLDQLVHTAIRTGVA